MSEKISLPKYDDIFSPTLKVLRTLGGSGAIDEINDAVAAAIGITKAQADVTYAKSGAPVLPDRLSWARSFLKLPWPGRQSHARCLGVDGSRAGRH